MPAVRNAEPVNKTLSERRNELQKEGKDIEKKHQNEIERAKIKCSSSDLI